MSTNATEAKRKSPMSGFGKATRARVLAGAAAGGAGLLSLSAATALVPAVGSTMTFMGGFVAQNPILVAVTVLFAVGHSPVLARFGKSSASGKAWVACSKCGRYFRDENEVARHSSGYHN